MAPVKMYTDIPRAWRAQICDPWAVMVVVTRKPLMIWRRTALAGWRVQEPGRQSGGRTVKLGAVAVVPRVHCWAASTPPEGADWTIVTRHDGLGPAIVTGNLIAWAVGAPKVTLRAILRAPLRDGPESRDQPPGA